MSGNKPEAPPVSFARVLKTSDVPPGSKKAIEVGGRSVLVCHSQDRFYAISNICSHAHEKLECGRMSKGWIACPAHGARFDLATGRAMNPPAVRGIRTFEIRIVDDWIEVLAEVEGEGTCLQGKGCGGG